jgi:hypothetical protein
VSDLLAEELESFSKGIGSNISNSAFVLNDESTASDSVPAAIRGECAAEGDQAIVTVRSSSRINIFSLFFFPIMFSLNFRAFATCQRTIRHGPCIIKPLSQRQYACIRSFSSNLNNDKLVQHPTSPFPKKENIMTIPNLLTLSRIIATPFIGYLIIKHQYGSALLALFFAGCTDLVDGYVARRFNQKTFLGSVLDPAADKILMTTLTLSLCKAGLLPCN